MSVRDTPAATRATQPIDAGTIIMASQRAEPLAAEAHICVAQLVPLEVEIADIVHLRRKEELQTAVLADFRERIG